MRTYALFSGGHDSLASTIIASRRADFAGVLHINTGIGIEETRAFVRDTCERMSWPLTELRSEASYEELVLTRGGFPYGPRAHSSMYWYLKQKPLNAWYRAQPGTVGLVTGIRKSESARRMNAGISIPVRRDGRRVWLSPLLDWSAFDCAALIEREGLERNPVVDFCHRSGECLCGALADQSELADIDLFYPAVGERIHALERECSRRGIVACVWAGSEARRLHPEQQRLFDKALLQPLCSSCEARAVA